MRVAGCVMAAAVYEVFASKYWGVAGSEAVHPVYAVESRGVAVLVTFIVPLDEDPAVTIFKIV